MIKFRLFAIAFFVQVAILSSSCVNSNNELILKDVVYGDDVNMQTMDVYLIADRTGNTPFIILVHGGGWLSGDKEDANFMVDACLSNGINVVNINYRLASSDLHYEDIMKDIDAAIDLIQRNEDNWNVRKDNYIFWGGSAGGHLAMLYAYNYDKRNVISAVITFGAPIKLDGLRVEHGAKQSDLEGLLPVITGKPWSSDSTLLSEEYKDASPYYGKRFVPTLLVHGEKDDIVPLSQSRMMSEKLKANNVPNSFIILLGGGHGGENTIEDVSAAADQAMLTWIRKYSN